MIKENERTKEEQEERSIRLQFTNTPFDATLSRLLNQDDYIAVRDFFNPKF